MFGKHMTAQVYPILLALLVALTAQAGAASDAELRRLTSNLESAKTQPDMNLASKKLADFWDSKLIAIEGRIEGRLDGKEGKEFADSKKRWRSHRSSEVAFRSGFFAGGSIQPLIANAAYSQITEHRVVELESLFRDALTGRAEPGGAAN